MQSPVNPINRFVMLFLLQPGLFCGTCRSGTSIYHLSTFASEMAKRVGRFAKYAARPANTGHAKPARARDIAVAANKPIAWPQMNAD
jgi:hypothetical protein